MTIASLKLDGPSLDQDFGQGEGLKKYDLRDIFAVTKEGCPLTYSVSSASASMPFIYGIDGNTLTIDFETLYSQMTEITFSFVVEATYNKN